MALGLALGIEGGLLAAFSLFSSRATALSPAPSSQQGPTLFYLVGPVSGDLSPQEPSVGQSPQTPQADRLGQPLAVNGRPRPTPAAATNAPGAVAQAPSLDGAFPVSPAAVAAAAVTANGTAAAADTPGAGPGTAGAAGTERPGPKAGSGEAAGSAGYGPAEAAFLSALERAINDKLIYPASARRSGIEGTVTLALAIGKNGSLTSRSIRQSSGSSILDSAALRLVDSVFPLDEPAPNPCAPVLNIRYHLASD